MRRIIMFTGLHVWSLSSKKGASSFYQTLTGYAERGYEIVLISSNRTDDLDIPEVSQRIIATERLGRLGRIPKVGFCFRFFTWFAFQVHALIVGFREIRLCRPAVLYAYEIAGVPAVLLLGRVFGLPVVTRFQGTIMKPLMAGWGWRLRYYDHWLGLRARANLVIMANDGTQGDEVLAALGVPQSSVRFWMNGVDVRPAQHTPQDLATHRQSLGLGSDTLVLLTVSRLVAWKRLERIISAMPVIRREIPEVRLVVVGDGAARADYERLVGELGLVDHVVFTGAVPHAEVARYIAISDLFVSLYDLSNVGNPLLEAMAGGKCVLTLNNGSTRSVVTNDVNGVLLEPGALNNLPATVIALLRDSGRRARLGQGAKEYAGRFFWTWTQRMDEEIAEVERLLVSNRSPVLCDP